MDVWTDDDFIRVDTQLSYNMGDDFLVDDFLNVVYLLLTGGTVESNGGDNEGLLALSKSRPGIVLVPRSELTMIMMLSVSFSLSIEMKLSFVLWVIK